MKMEAGYRKEALNQAGDGVSSTDQSGDGDGAGGEMYFESIDIQPDLRIPGPRQSWWTRCWKPIGTTIMETGVLQEPRGVMRILEWLFAICAFGTCADFITHMQYTVTCPGGQSHAIQHNATYPFVMGKHQTVSVFCGSNDTEPILLDPPGDFSSDARFFVFTGVISFLAAMALLVVYVFFSPIYESESKKAPLIDFCFTVVIAVFWLSASAAWANGLSGMKHVYGGDWLHASQSGPCPPPGSNGGYTFSDCEISNTGSYGGANVSIVLGFLNFFLWTSNLWFLYKETAWFEARNPRQESLGE